jgi:prevent-host-death family protein
MKRVKIAELKDQLSKHLRAVERGAEIEVTDRNRPIARLVPVPQQAPEVRIFPARRPFAGVRGKVCRRARWPVSAVDLLLEDRRKR